MDKKDDLVLDIEKYKLSTKKPGVAFGGVTATGCCNGPSQLGN